MVIEGLDPKGSMFGGIIVWLGRLSCRGPRIAALRLLLVSATAA